ncbi:MAG: hypothetical protein NTW38_00100 [Candidatus Aminicenantes bacterium]|nr:hypothetical protein [Candidatus Aminicenantes bacterium]
MKNLKTLIRVTMGLGVLSLLGGVSSHLALTDINHGGAELTLEWTILRVSALVFAAFIGLALLTLSRVLKKIS